MTPTSYAACEDWQQMMQISLGLFGYIFGSILGACTGKVGNWTLVPIAVAQALTISAKAFINFRRERREGVNATNIVGIIR